MKAVECIAAFTSPCNLSFLDGLLTWKGLTLIKMGHDILSV